MASLPSGNNPFAGGAQQRNLTPPGVGGGIASANTNVGSPAGGVNPGAPFHARPNEGSNIGIPYTRLVPLNPDRYKRGFDDSDDPTMKAMVTETQQLRATCVAFILGKRSTIDNQAIDGFDRGDRSQLNLARNSIMPGMAGTERFQQLCSLEFLQRYFHNVLANKVIRLYQPMNQVPKFKAPDQYAVPTGDEQTMLNATDLAKDTALAGVPPNVGAANSPVAKSKTRYQGIFCMDDGPFLRGKGVSQQVISGSTDKLKKPRMISRNLGDECAFSALNQEMANFGLMDWTPDGIVLSKGDNDPRDQESDAYLDARDGQLYNIRVQGPAISSSWTGDPAMEVLPGDKLFVVLVADVWFKGGGEFVDDFERNKGVNGTDDAPAKSARQAYEEAREAEFANNPVTGDADDRKTWAGKQYAAYKGNGDETVLTNFRPMLATSSQMINYSHLKFNNGTHDADGNEDEKLRRIKYRSRMGLRLSQNVGEYIVGGWCIGAVLDSSASRAAFPGAGSNIGVRTAPNTMALNVNVNISYWDGDRLYRNFMNKENTLKPRYIRRDRGPLEALNLGGGQALIAVGEGLVGEEDLKKKSEDITKALAEAAKSVPAAEGPPKAAPPLPRQPSIAGNEGDAGREAGARAEELQGGGAPPLERGASTNPNQQRTQARAPGTARAQTPGRARPSGASAPRPTGGARP